MSFTSTLPLGPNEIRVCRRAHENVVCFGAPDRYVGWCSTCETTVPLARLGAVRLVETPVDPPVEIPEPVPVPVPVPEPEPEPVPVIRVVPDLVEPEPAPVPARSGPVARCYRCRVPYSEDDFEPGSRYCLRCDRARAGAR